MKDNMTEVFKAEMNKIAVKGLVLFGITFISAIIGVTMYISNIASTVEQHGKFIDSGERFTQSDGDLLQIQIEANREFLSNVARASDVQELKESFIRLDERLRNRGI